MLPQWSHTERSSNLNAGGQSPATGPENPSVHADSEEPARRGRRTRPAERPARVQAVACRPRRPACGERGLAVRQTPGRPGAVCSSRAAEPGTGTRCAVEGSDPGRPATDRPRLSPTPAGRPGTADRPDREGVRGTVISGRDNAAPHGLCPAGGSSRARPLRVDARTADPVRACVIACRMFASLCSRTCAARRACDCQGLPGHPPGRRGATVLLVPAAESAGSGPAVAGPGRAACRPDARAGA